MLHISNKILVSEYDPSWPQHFRLEAVLGNRALRIEHTGSTSVPGLAAKPIIDILLVVSNSADEEAYALALEATGYVLRISEPDWYEHRMFKGPDTPINLHVLSLDCPEIYRILLLRDWLRTHPVDRDLYESCKLALAAREWRSVDEYANAKTAVIEEILARACLDRK